jgi:hypothetical protein
VGFQFSPAGSIETFVPKSATVLPIDRKPNVTEIDRRRDIISRAVGQLPPGVVRPLLAALTSGVPISDMTDEQASSLKSFVLAVMRECKQAGVETHSVLKLNHSKVADRHVRTLMKTGFGEQLGVADNQIGKTRPPWNNSLASVPAQSDESSCAEAQKVMTTNMTNSESNGAEVTATAAEKGANVAPQRTSSKKQAPPKKAATKGQKAAKDKKHTGRQKAKPASKVVSTRGKKASTPRVDSKGAQVLALISRVKGATLTELMKATGWQAHSIRGFISGTLGKKKALTVESSRREDGERLYSLKH